MAIDYTTLVADKTTEGSIKNWVNRSDVPATDILNESEAWIYQHLRIREMLAFETVTIALDADSAALPDGFLDPEEYRPFQSGRPLLYVHEASLNRQRDENGDLFPGTPSRWAVIGETMCVDVTTTAAFGGEMLFYKQPDPLSGSNTTNFLTTRYPTLLRRSCMARAFEHMKDFQRMDAEEKRAMVAIVEANMTNELYRRSQSHPG